MPLATCCCCPRNWLNCQFSLKAGTIKEGLYIKCCRKNFTFLFTCVLVLCPKGLVHIGGTVVLELCRISQAFVWILRGLRCLHTSPSRHHSTCILATHTPLATPCFSWSSVNFWSHLSLVVYLWPPGCLLLDGFILLLHSLHQSCPARHMHPSLHCHHSSTLLPTLALLTALHLASISGFLWLLFGFLLPLHSLPAHLCHPRQASSSLPHTCLLPSTQCFKQAQNPISTTLLSLTVI